jgi:hypothetical protein
MYKFETQTGNVSIDQRLCGTCESKACVKACSLYNGGIYKIQGGKPLLAISYEDAKQGRCIECLACEYECFFRGKKALKISMPFKPI